MDNHNNILRPQQQYADNSDVRPADALGVRFDSVESAAPRQRRAVRYDSGVHYVDGEPDSTAPVVSILLGVVSLLLLLLTPMMMWLSGAFIVTSCVSVWAGVKALRTGRQLRPAPRVMACAGMLISIALLTVFVLTVIWIVNYGYQLPY